MNQPRSLALTCGMALLPLALGLNIVSPLAQAAPLFETVLLLDGVDDYAEAPDHPSLDVGTGATDDFTLEAFFYVPDHSNNGTDVVLWKQGAYAVFIVFSSSAADRIFFRLWTGGAGQFVTLDAEVDFAVGWHHIAAVFDNEQTESQDVRAIFVDGRRVARSTSIEWTPGIPNTSSEVFVGAYAGNNPAHGFLEEVRISARVRYRQASYPVPLAPFSPDAETRALWRFNAAAGATAFGDASGHGNRLIGHNGARTARPPIGGGVTGVNPMRVSCRNMTTGQAVVLLDPTPSWNCEAAGLVVRPNDEIRQSARGIADQGDVVGGTVTGIRPTRIVCTNLTTEQVIPLSDPTPTWDCQAAGLVVTIGDRIRQSVLGVAP